MKSQKKKRRVLRLIKDIQVNISTEDTAKSSFSIFYMFSNKSMDGSVATSIDVFYSFAMLI